MNVFGKKLIRNRKDRKITKAIIGMVYTPLALLIVAGSVIAAS